MPGPGPLIFISHKHRDKAIAQVLAAFIESRTNNLVRVHLSSSPDFAGPRYGKSLNAQLRKALWETEVLILLYTSSDDDWSYCMWECGVATHPQSPNTDIIVFQCGEDVPAPFKDLARVCVHKFDDIKRFTDQLLRDDSLFPSLKAAIAPNLRDAHVETAAKELYARFAEVVPKPSDGLVEEWPAWPYLRIELPRTEVDRIEQATEVERLRLAHQIVRDHAVIAENDSRAAQLFGRAGFPKGMKFEALLSLWKDKYPNSEQTWFDSCCDQIMTGARREFPVIRWTPMKEVAGDAEFTPVLSRVRRVPFAGVVHFDLFFYDLADPRAIPVTMKMIPSDKFFYKKVDEGGMPSISLKDLVEELDVQRLNRVPLLTGQGHPVSIVHRSMIDKFIVRRVLSGAQSAAGLTLSDLFNDPEMKDVFDNTFVVVRKQATLAEARGAMVARPGCSDVFVTSDGTRNQPVQGWLTNVDIARSS
jgi:hypothetical protein